MIERYDTFNTKVSPYELPFSVFYYQPITPDYHDSHNYDDEDDNNIPVTPVDNFLTYKKVVEYEFVPKY